ncbi:hypothetical protein QBC43DRAFT_286263 [Cladorrhinum sp. PSN259]|nr:hypothetical protein QBC43DRAFT_286263 [Cladorrhinum sp. PSN259]
MASFLSIKSLLVTTVALFSSAFAQSQTGLIDEKLVNLKSKQILFGGLDALDDIPSGGGLRGRPAVPFTKHEVPWGTIPSQCLMWGPITGNSSIGLPGERCKDIYTMEVYQVEYDDCPGHTFTFCRCADSPMSIDELGDELSKIPFKARQWVTTVSAEAHESQQPNSCTAAAFGTHIWINGNCKGFQRLWFHEFGHVLDRAVLQRTEKGSYWWSDEARWRNTVLGGADCLPSNYSTNTWPDNFAEFVAVAAYHHLVKDVYKTFRANLLECLEFPLDLTIELTRELFAPKGKQVCDEAAHSNLKDLTYVCMGPGARAQGACEDVPDWEGHSADDTEEDEYIPQTALETFQSDMSHVEEGSEDVCS